MTGKRQFRAIKGVRDILPPETALWNRVEETARDVFGTYGYGEIRLPVLEDTQLFAGSIGAETDVISKEMYTFPDRPEPDDARAIREWMDRTRNEPPPDQQSDIEIAPMRWPMVSLRPEATASVCRAYIEHGMHTWAQPVKLYYIGPMFRRERPQKGRYRQFYQIGAEVLTSSHEENLEADARVDAEVIEMLLAFFGRLGLEGTKLYVNSIGCKECRPKYVELLREELKKVKEKLGVDSQRRIETNPLRVLDSKVPEEQAIIEKLPRISDHLCAACRENFAKLQEELKLRRIDYETNWRLVRGLDYYTRTTFEITASGLGSQNAVCGGGRYDGLVELLGGPPTKGIGFAIGTDRVILSLQEASKEEAKKELDVFIAWMGGTAYGPAVRLARELRDVGLSVELPPEEMKFKKSLGLADKLGARYALIIGEDEVASGQFTLKSLADGEQRKLSGSMVVEYLDSGRRGSGA
jgi:histidyl-tRNA synthetase